FDFSKESNTNKESIIKESSVVESFWKSEVNIKVAFYRCTNEFLDYYLGNKTSMNHFATL
ncbi:16552_t:CDS:2, partial [Gigaspora margarita]